MEKHYTVITGCNRGIGKASLEKFAKEGKNIIAVVRKNEESFAEYVSKLASENDVTIDIVTADFNTEDAVRGCAKKIVGKKIHVEALINNVGVLYPQRSFVLTKMDTIKEVFQINFFSQLLFTQIISRSMMKTGGSIVFVTSVSAYDGGGNIEYSASKAAIIGEVHRLALELSQYNIRVNGVAPGLTETDMSNTMSDEDKKIALQMNIMNRLGNPNEIANVIFFLASEDASFITSQIIRVDGGIR